MNLRMPTAIMFRSIATTASRNARLFSTAPALRKSALDSAKETAKSVDQTISAKAVSGIEKGEELAQKTKETAGMSAAEAKNKASEAANQAQAKAEETAGMSAAEAKGKAQGKAEEMKGSAK